MLFYVLFGILGVGLAIVQIRQGVEGIQQSKDAALASQRAAAANDRAEVARDRLVQAMDSLRAKTDEEADALRKMNAAQDEVKKLSDSNRKLAGETLQQVIGDPVHPPYLRFYDFDFSESEPQARAYLVNSSQRYAARVVSMTVQMRNQTFTSESQDISPTASGLLSRVSVVFPSTGLGDSRMVHLDGMTEIGKAQVLDVVLATAAGIYRQRTALIRTSDKQIVQAWRVFNSTDMSRPLLAERELAFPENFDWNQFEGK